MSSEWALLCTAVPHGCPCSRLFVPWAVAVGTAPRSFPEACGQKMHCNPMQTAFCMNAYVPVGTSHRQNEYFKFHVSLCKVKPSKSRWRGCWYRESSLVDCPLSSRLPSTVPGQMLLSAGGAVGLRMPSQLSFLEERPVEKEMQLLGAAPILERWLFPWLAFTVAAA